jgi:two-component system response regulator RegA
MTIAKMILVEDDSAFRGRLAVSLESRGIRVVQAGTVAEAKKLARSELFDGAVVDLRVPDGSGLDVLQELREAQPAIRVVVLTGFGSIASALQAVRLGAMHYLTKPANADEIVAALSGENRVTENPKEVPDGTPSLDRVEWEHIQRVLVDTKNNISQSARILGLDRRSLQRKLRKYPPVR